jgi:isoleucyl-tRNA synthetase
LGDLSEAAALLHGTLAWEQALAIPEAPEELFQDVDRATPADALRWAAYSGTMPAEAERDVLRPLWQAVIQLQDAAISQDPEVPTVKSSRAKLLDRWLKARVHQTIVDVTEALDACDPHQATYILATLVSDITGWYATYGDGLTEGVAEPLSRLVAPFVPYLAEAMNQQATSQTAKSLHLKDWPQPDHEQIDEQLLADMALLHHLMALGRAARVQAGVEVDQPLRRALVSWPERERAPALSQEFVALLSDALAVSHVSIGSEATDTITWRVKLVEKRSLERGVQSEEIAEALALLEHEAMEEIVLQVRNGLSIGLDVDGQTVTLLPDEVTITAQAPSGWVAMADKGYLVLLEQD